MRALQTCAIVVGSVIVFPWAMAFVAYYAIGFMAGLVR